MAAADADAATRTTWVLVLAAAALGMGAFGRYPLGTADAGLLAVAAFAVGVAVLAWPLLVAEAALGRFRRRNAVAAFGPGAWRAAGALAALACLAAAAYLAIVAGWAGRSAFDAFTGDHFDAPGQRFRLVSQGWDAMVGALAAVLVAAAAAMASLRDPRRGLVAAVAVLGLIALAALATWGLWSGGDAGRDAAFALPWRDVDAALVVGGLQRALVPALLGLGAVLTLSAQMPDRGLPRSATTLALAWVGTAAAAGAGLTALAHGEGVALDDGLAMPFTSAIALADAIGGTLGGVLAGTVAGILLAGSLAALVLVLEVPARWLTEAFPSWTLHHGLIASALAAYLLAVPLAFVAGLAFDVELALTAIVAPLGGLLVAVHVGWVRPEVLGGLTVGDANHDLHKTLKPALRYALPPVLLALLVLGTLGALADWGALERGSGALWSLVP